MATEEDNFDIDIYGDDGTEGNDYKQDEEQDFKLEDETPQSQVDPPDAKDGESSDTKPMINSTESVSGVDADLPKQQPQQQGTKRKESSDERPIDPGSTNALMISELHWWMTEDDVRGWANQANCEDELKDVTFSEHKVNGKSKGQAFVEFSSPQAATATKQKIESIAKEQPGSRKHTVAFANHHQNPFKTSPKDAPARAKEERSQRSASGSYNPPAHQNNYSQNSGFRGGRGGGYNRAGYNNAGYNNNRGYSVQRGGYNNNSSSNNNNNNMAASGFQNTANPMMNNFGGFNRGGMGSMQGGRGGMNGMNGMMPMGGMAMGMNPMMGNMGMHSFPANTTLFNPAMFNQGGPQNWNQQGNKRQRQE